MTKLINIREAERRIDNELRKGRRRTSRALEVVAEILEYKNASLPECVEAVLVHIREQREKLAGDPEYPRCSMKEKEGRLKRLKNTQRGNSAKREKYL